MDSLLAQGYEPIVDPYTELANLAGEILQVKGFFRERVEALEQLKDEGSEGVATQIDVLVSAYERAMDRSEKILTNMSRLDLDARIAALHAKIDDATAEVVSRALDKALSKTELSPAERADVLTTFGRALREPHPAALQPA
jgi:hypothetical protein